MKRPKSRIGSSRSGPSKRFGAKGDRHRWNSWDNYQAVHASRIADFAHFILEDRVAFAETAESVLWDGTLICQGGIEIEVTKLQRRRHRFGRIEVETVEYRYHALRRLGARVTSLFRYDNAHPHPDHPDAHHRHRFDAEGTEILPAQHVGRHGWPTFGDVIEEAFAHWQERQV